MMVTSSRLQRQNLYKMSLLYWSDYSESEIDSIIKLDYKNLPINCPGSMYDKGFEDAAIMIRNYINRIRK